MKFEVSERIISMKSQDEILAALEVQFNGVSKKVLMSGKTIVVDTIKSSLISGLRSDITTISLKKEDGGWIAIADVQYRPSVSFWISLVVLLLFTWVGWIVPIIFYQIQKKTLRTAITECFQGVKK